MHFFSAFVRRGKEIKEYDSVCTVICNRHWRLRLHIRILPQKMAKAPQGGFCHFGPSDRIRTCGIVVPNHARYQLRYTRSS